jgi:hypothetical protein
MSKMQKSLDAWEGGLRTTGGAIVPEKSRWYLIEFGWKNGNPFYKLVAESPAVLTVRDYLGYIRTLRQLEPTQGERTLGIRLAPDENIDVQFEHMRQTPLRWADRTSLWLSPLTPYRAGMEDDSPQTLEYPLPVTMLSRIQCNKLTSIAQAT